LTGGLAAYRICNAMALDRNEPKDRPQHLPFERPLVEIAEQIQQLENLAQANEMDFSEEIENARRQHDRIIREIFSRLSPWQRIMVARHPARPQTADYLETTFDDFIELHGDKAFRDDPAVACGFARLDGMKVMFIGQRKGRDTKESVEFNWGYPHPEGYRKALEKMKTAEKFGIPVVSLIDTKGAYPGIGAEERGQSGAIAKNLMEMAVLRVPIVCTVISEGGSGGALGIGVGDRLLMLEHAYYSVISPEGCAAILWKDASRKEEAAKALRLTAQDLHLFGIVDEIIPEPGAAHLNPPRMSETLKEVLAKHVRELAKLDTDKLLELRYEKIRSIGIYRDGQTNVGGALRTDVDEFLEEAHTRARELEGVGAEKGSGVRPAVEPAAEPPAPIPEPPAQEPPPSPEPSRGPEKE